MGQNQSSQQQNQQQQSQQQEQKKSRRVRADQNNRDYTCGCGKSYLSYPALYTHIKQKHDKQIPQGTRKPQKNKGQRGRPSLNQNAQQYNNDNMDYDQDTDDQSNDSNDALNIIEELVLYLYESLNDVTIIQNENDQLTLQQIKQAFPKDKQFYSFFPDYKVLEDHLELIYGKKFEEGQLKEDGLYDTKCNFVFALFIEQASKHLQADILKEIIFYCYLFRKALNEKGWEIINNNNCQHLEFCNENNAQNVLEISNEFVTEILPTYLEQFDLSAYRVINKENLYKQIVKITKYFCNWLYAKKYTNSILQANNDETNNNPNNMNF